MNRAGGSSFIFGGDSPPKARVGRSGNGRSPGSQARDAAVAAMNGSDIFACPELPKHRISAAKARRAARTQRLRSNVARPSPRSRRIVKRAWRSFRVGTSSTTRYHKLDDRAAGFRAHRVGIPPSISKRFSSPPATTKATTAKTTKTKTESRPRRRPSSKSPKNRECSRSRSPASPI